MAAAPGLYTIDTLPPGEYRRMVSLVPSITQTIGSLGGRERLVGRTRFCISPEAVLDVPRIGGTKDPDPERIRKLKPDLILAVKEENRKEDVEALAQECPVLVFDVKTVEEGLDMLTSLGRLLGCEEQRLEAYRHLALADDTEMTGLSLRVLYLIWREPYMTIGHDTYIADMLRHAAMALPWENVTRYPVIDLEAVLKQGSVDAVLLSDEPYPFKETDAAAMREKFGVPAYTVNGMYASWYGNLTPTGLDYLRDLRRQILADIRPGLP